MNGPVLRLLPPLATDTWLLAPATALVKADAQLLSHTLDVGQSGVWAEPLAAAPDSCTAADTPRGTSFQHAAAERDFALVAFNLGRVRERGHGACQDSPRAEVWFAREAAHGHPPGYGCGTTDT